MPDPQQTVFISYRRDVSAFIARAIYLELSAHGYDVFMDVESIDAGRFEQVIFNQIAARAHFLPILSPGTLERCANPDDLVRREITFAIARDRNIVPLLVNNFSFADYADVLTGPLARLPGFSGLTVPHEYFDAAMDKLRTRFLSQPVAVTLQPAPGGDQPTVDEHLEAARSAPTPDQEELAAERAFDRGYAAYEAGDYDQAIRAYTESLHLAPDWVMTYNNRGLAYYHSGQVEEAIPDFTRSIELEFDPLFEAYNNRGSARYALGDLEGAQADYTRAIEIAPQDAGGYYNRGNVRGDLEDFDGAMEDINRAIALKPDYAEAYNSRGNVHLVREEWTEAVADYQRSLELGNPEPAIPHLNLGLARMQMGDAAGALAEFETCLELGGERFRQREDIQGFMARLREQLDGD